IRNYEPDRWPAGDPDYRSSNRTFFGDVDTGATKSFLLSKFKHRDNQTYYLLSFGRRPAEELYDMEADPHQLKNIAENEEFSEIKSQLASKMDSYLEKTGDPRQRGEAPWDSYRYVREEIYGFPNWEIRGMADDPK
ncbi:MAG: hypothetical protein AAF585_28545, partial [Verrucomicrobiota bacterium]